MNRQEKSVEEADAIVAQAERAIEEVEGNLRQFREFYNVRDTLVIPSVF